MFENEEKNLIDTEETNGRIWVAAGALLVAAGFGVYAWMKHRREKAAIRKAQASYVMPEQDDIDIYEDLPKVDDLDIDDE